TILSGIKHKETSCNQEVSFLHYNNSSNSVPASLSADDVYVSIPATALSIIGSKSTRSSKCFTFSSEGFVFGDFGLNIVQQSSNGRIDVSYVPNCLAILTMSFFSCVSSGLSTGRLVTSLIAYMLVSVCEATRSDEHTS